MVCDLKRWQRWLEQGAKILIISTWFKAPSTYDTTTLKRPSWQENLLPSTHGPLLKNTAGTTAVATHNLGCVADNADSSSGHCLPSIVCEHAHWHRPISEEVGLKNNAARTLRSSVALMNASSRACISSHYTQALLHADYPAANDDGTSCANGDMLFVVNMWDRISNLKKAKQ